MTKLSGLTIPVLVIVVLVILVVIGLKAVPAPFAAFPLEPGVVSTIPLPAGLSAPVERFYRTVHGERIPVITSVVMTGRAKVRPFGRPTFNARFRFTHIAGRSYRHYIEATFFGLPIMKINGSYIDGHSRCETPMEMEEGEPKTEQAATLGMWAELSGVPAALLTDPRVHWEAVDAETAILAVPYQGIGTERFLVRFDPTTGHVTFMEVMRCQRKDSAQKTLWVTKALTWDRRGEYTTSTKGPAWWYGFSRPWAIFSTEDIVLNAELSSDIGKRGE